ncbi:glycosyltransferase family 8 [Micractinium conductrix]|uniref:Glycosyltransferase family 8 n=1 Tax=Micractinium conductrix TaxID=554055 RepID=A0A2P6VGZ4_9CHLO|nr:glycosyltransferase family 8 [Micractinium conductrix]|eukprot:PSC73361.1 glycosyltransferase family 8 [Micractinium conductrix]
MPGAALEHAEPLNSPTSGSGSFSAAGVRPRSRHHVISPRRVPKRAVSLDLENPRTQSAAAAAAAPAAVAATNAWHHIHRLGNWQRSCGGRCARPRRTFVLLLLACVLLFAATGAIGEVRAAGKKLVRHLYYGYDPMLLGRNSRRFPSPSCCAGGACAAPRTGRTAVLTLVRSDNHLPLLQQLECTLRRSNPGVEFGVLMVPGELGAEALAWMERKNLTRLEVPPLYYPNAFNPSYGDSWAKLRLFALTQYDAVVFVDSGAVVAGDLSPLFSLPTEFAASWDQSTMFGRGPRLQGLNSGLLLVRPCAAMLEHMLQLLRAHAKLRFTYAAAEQEFLNWYFRFTGMMLPVEYNTMTPESLRGNLTLGGRHPVVVRFGEGGAVPGTSAHQYLCTQRELG